MAEMREQGWVRSERSQMQGRFWTGRKKATRSEEAENPQQRPNFHPDGTFPLTRFKRQPFDNILAKSA